MFFNRRKKIIKQIQAMNMSEKCSLLNQLIQPFGFSYILSQDVFTSRVNAWQRDYGYCELYDKAAHHFNIIFNRLPIYFDYQGRTWLIEFWKGQYGINTGCEIGVYYADKILDTSERKSAFFRSVEEQDMLKLSAVLQKNGDILSHLCAKHWWLTAFHPGYLSVPNDLCLRAVITFPCSAMAHAFLRGLEESKSERGELDNTSICKYCNRVTITFGNSTSCYSRDSSHESTHRFHNNRFLKLRNNWIFCKIRFWLKLYYQLTKPFSHTVDRILFLSSYVPFIFSKLFWLRRFQ